MPTTSNLRFDGRTAIVMGAGQGLGRAYAHFLASLGANVLVHDFLLQAAEAVSSEIRSLGWNAAACSSNKNKINGTEIVDAALKLSSGRIDIIINTATIPQNKTFDQTTDKDWDEIISINLHCAYSVVKAAWPYMQKQKFGRILNTASHFGIYTNSGKASFSAAMMGAHGFALSLAKEGARANIFCNTIVPISGSDIQHLNPAAKILAGDALSDFLNPIYISPIVGFLVHESCSETGSIFELGGSFAAKLRRERSNGVVFKSAFLTPGQVASEWPRVCDFDSAPVSYPSSIVETDWISLLEKSTSKSSTNPRISPQLRFDGKVVIVTGAGAGLGRAYARLFGALGASVLINDLNVVDATKVVEEIKRGGGKAALSALSVEEGDGIVAAAVSAFGGRIDVVVNNAGILRDKSFARMSDLDWDLVLKVHLRGTFKVAKAAWPYMVRQNYGRIINTTSAVGLYGNFGQTNYAAAKAAIIGLSNTLSEEGYRYNIFVNTIAPNAGTQMTATVMPPEMVEALKPDFIAPFVAFLAHDKNSFTGGIYECGSCWAGAVRWQRSEGIVFSEKNLTIETVQDSFSAVSAFNRKKSAYSFKSQDAFQSILGLIFESNRKTNSESSYIDRKLPEKGKLDNISGSVDIKKARALKIPALNSKYIERDVILYALAIGASRSELQWVYEGSHVFHAIPSFGVIMGFSAMLSVPFGDFIEGFSPEQIVHGEQYMELFVAKLPTSGEIQTKAEILDIIDKGKSAHVIIGTTTHDKKTNQVLCYNESLIIVRGHGGFQKEKVEKPLPSRRKYGKAEQLPNERIPDFIVNSRVPEDQAALYRLSGDPNPLHIDPEFSSMGGYPIPILHGLCSLGYGVRNVFSNYESLSGDRLPDVAAIQCRMSSHVVPGDNLVTEMWQINPTRVIFQVRDVNRDGVVVLANSSVDFFKPVVPCTKSKNNSKKNVLLTNKNQDGSPVSKIFKRFQQTMDKMPVEVRQALIKRVMAIITFEVKSKANEIQKFVLDLKGKDGGKAFEVTSDVTSMPSKPDLQIIAEEEVFIAIANGQLSGQKAFMQQKIKAKGNLLLASKIDQVFNMLLDQKSKI